MRPDHSSDTGKQSLPRTLLIDPTAFGGGSATGELKRAYFRDSGDRLLHLTAGPGRRLRMQKGGARPGSDGLTTVDSEDLMTECRSFEPDVILYRPVAEVPDLHRAAMRIIRELGRPWVIWLMDDWPERLRTQNAERFGKLDRDLRELLRGASDRFAISEAMAEAFRERYGVLFKVYRNGAEAEEWIDVKPRPSRDGSVRIRYAGSLAPDTTRDSVLEVARITAELSASIPVSLDIHTQRAWLEAEGKNYEGLRNVTIDSAGLTPSAYRQWLADADILLVAYNFDPETIRYLRYSFGNKVPEYLASGAAVLAYGPAELAGIKFLAGTGAAIVVDRPGRDELRRAVQSLVRDASRRADLGRRGRMLAFLTLDIERQRKQFVTDLQAAAGVSNTARPESTLPTAPTKGRVRNAEAPPSKQKSRSVFRRLRKQAEERARVMRRRPFLWVCIFVAALTVLATAVAWPLLSALAVPEVRLALLGANLLLIVLLGRVIRKSLFGRLATLDQRIDERLKRIEASFETQISGLRSQILKELRRDSEQRRLDVETLMDTIARRQAEATWALPFDPVAPVEEVREAEAGHATGADAGHGQRSGRKGVANGTPEIGQSQPATSEPAVGDTDGAYPSRSDTDQAGQRRDR